MYHGGNNSALHYSIKSELLEFNTFMCNVIHSSVSFILFSRPATSKKVTMDLLTVFHSEPSCDFKFLSHLQIDKSGNGMGALREEGKVLSCFQIGSFPRVGVKIK